MRHVQPDDSLGKEELANELAIALSDVVTFQYTAHGFHWNVRGPMFSQFHEFFGEIYEDAQGSEDELAENIRRLGYDAPFALPQFLGLTGIRFKSVLTSDPLEMSSILLEANGIVLTSLQSAFDVANAINEQGTANFLAERLDMHKKWQWQLKSTLGFDQEVPGKTEAESPLEVSDYDYSLFDTDIQPEELFIPIVAAAGDCPPATQDISINLANREKAIQTAGYGPLNPQEPNEEFWQEKANRWSVDVTEAKKSVCGNCVMFIRTPKMLDCIEGGLTAGDSSEQNAWDAIDTAELGYCEAFDFKCAASRTCSAWVVGGPITEEKNETELSDDTVSYTPEQARDAVYASAVLVPEEKELADALVKIAGKYGKFNDDNTGIWAGYTPASENVDKAAIGVKCGNCVFFNAPNGCSIIAAEVEEGGLCRFAVLPDGAVTPNKVFSKSPSFTQEYLKKEIEENEDDYTEEYVNISDLIPTQDQLKTRKLRKASENNKPVIVYKDSEGYKLVDGHHRCAAKMLDGQTSIMARVYRGTATVAAGSRRAPKKDRIHGSKKNAKGSAKNKSKKITFSKEVEASLRKKVSDHNEKVKAEGKQATLPMLKAVYRRGAGAYSSSHRPNTSRAAWAMARVNAFLHLLKTGKPGNPKYNQDNDLLPKSHPKASKAVTASIFTELTVELKEEGEYSSPEHAIFALAEFSGAGYEIIPALKASWARAVKNDEKPFERAMNLAINLYNSNDADLLPAVKKGTPQ